LCSSALFAVVMSWPPRRRVCRSNPFASFKLTHPQGRSEDQLTCCPWRAARQVKHGSGVVKQPSLQTWPSGLMLPDKNDTASPPKTL
jgi:hypothetical protein